MRVSRRTEQASAIPPEGSGEGQRTKLVALVLVTVSCVQSIYCSACTCKNIRQVRLTVIYSCHS